MPMSMPPRLVRMLAPSASPGWLAPAGMRLILAWSLLLRFVFPAAATDPEPARKPGEPRAAVPAPTPATMAMAAFIRAIDTAPAAPANPVSAFLEDQWVAHRAPAGWVLFSWQHPIFGWVSPSGRFPWASEASPEGFIGRLLLASPDPALAAGEPPPLLRQLHFKELKSGFVLSGELLRVQARILHQFAFISLPDGLVAYLERLTAVEPVTLASIQTGTIQILSTAAQGISQHAATHILYSSRGELDLAKSSPSSKVTDLKSRWVNLDDRLGLIALGESSWVHASDSKALDPSPGKLFLAAPEQRDFASDDIILQRGVAAALGRTRAQTAHLARLLAQEGDLQTSRVQFVLGPWLIAADFDEPAPEVFVEAQRANESPAPDAP